MSNLSRTLAVAAVALLGASVAPAQTPGLRGNTGVRTVTTVSPVPAMQMQQQQMWQNAFLQAQLWQMYNPPVVIVNNPWAYSNPGVNFHSNVWAPAYSTPGTIWNSNNSFYRNNNLNWGNQPGLYRAYR